MQWIQYTLLIPLIYRQGNADSAFCLHTSERLSGAWIEDAVTLKHTRGEVLNNKS